MIVNKSMNRYYIFSMWLFYKVKSFYNILVIKNVWLTIHIFYELKILNHVRNNFILFLKNIKIRKFYKFYIYITKSSFGSLSSISKITFLWGWFVSS